MDGRTAAPLAAPRAGRWTAPVFLALAQLMIALDATITNVALPSVQAGLGFGDAERQWVIDAYTLAFGALLLLGRRISDRIGRSRAFVVGPAGIAAASGAPSRSRPPAPRTGRSPRCSPPPCWRCAPSRSRSCASAPARSRSSAPSPQAAARPGSCSVGC